MILVTGATGFLGAELILQLNQQSLKLRALRRQHSKIPRILEGIEGIEWFTADINDLATLEEAFEGITQVYHCAALVSFLPADKKRLLKVNIEGTSNVVNLCAAYNVRLLHVSSVATLGDAKKGKQITEDDLWEYNKNAHTYAISKYGGEMEVWRSIAEGLNAVIVNPAVIIGASAGVEGSGAIFKLVKEGLPYYTRGVTGLVDVKDVAKSMVTLMNSDIHSERFTISAENYGYQQFLTAIAKGFGKKAPTIEAKKWMLSLAWRAAKLGSWLSGKPTGLTRDSARSSLNQSFYNNDKIKNTIGIEFKPLQQSIAEVCTSFHTC